jgi:hypothetical protein
MKYEVYFEFFGRKMRMEVDATSEQAAKNIITNKIMFHKVKLKKVSDDDVVNHLKNMFGMK